MSAEQWRKVSINYQIKSVNYFLKSGDQSWLPSVAKSLINLQEWFGPIPNVHLHGNCAKVTMRLFFFQILSVTFCDSFFFGT